MPAIQIDPEADMTFRIEEGKRRIDRRLAEMGRKSISRPMYFLSEPNPPCGGRAWILSNSDSQIVTAHKLAKHLCIGNAADKQILCGTETNKNGYDVYNGYEFCTYLIMADEWKEPRWDLVKRCLEALLGSPGKIPVG